MQTAISHSAPASFNAKEAGDFALIGLLITRLIRINRMLFVLFSDRHLELAGFDPGDHLVDKTERLCGVHTVIMGARK